MGLPIGTIIAYAGPCDGPAPDGWEWCFGSQVHIRGTRYEALYSVIGELYGKPTGDDLFFLPNLSGYFLRGVDPSAAGHRVDVSDRRPLNPTLPPHYQGVGSLQDDGIARHFHLNSSVFQQAEAGAGYRGFGTGSNSDQDVIPDVPTVVDYGGLNAKAVYQDGALGPDPAGPDDQEETRPKNIAVAYLVKLTAD